MTILTFEEFMSKHRTTYFQKFPNPYCKERNFWRNTSKAIQNGDGSDLADGSKWYNQRKKGIDNNLEK